jgi:hypothetical protein
MLVADTGTGPWVNAAASIVVALLVATLIDRVFRARALRAAAARTGIEAELLARISAEPVREGSLGSLLDHVRAALRMDGAALTETGPDGVRRVLAAAGRADDRRRAVGGGMDQLCRSLGGNRAGDRLC